MTLSIMSFKVEATDDDCSNVDHRVCDYQITTPDVPFSIDSNGLISIKSSLTNNLYEFDVVAIDCYSSSSSDNKAKMISEPAKVMIKIIKSCKPTIKGRKIKILFLYVLLVVLEKMAFIYICYT